MASVSIMQPNRSRSDSLLQGSALGSRFHVLFDSFDDRHRKNDKKKSKKKGKIKAKDKGKSKREKSPEKFESQPPSVELHGNSSAFGVYCGVRQAVMEQQIQQASQIYMSTIRPQANDAESDDELDNKIKDATLKIPKIVGIGLCGVFELIKETQTSHPALCTRALQALFCMLQGQHPESMKTEPPEVIDALFVLLMDLATVSGPNPGHRAASDSMTALACSCLLSLALARGDTGKILAALSSMLMSPAALATQQIKVPDILSSLQRSVQAVLLGRTQLPTWLGSGIPNKSKVDTFTIEQLTPLSDNEGSAIASDGSFLYIHNRDGLHKVGTGYGGTLKGHVYMMNPDFHPKEHGWLGFVKQLYYKSMNEVSDAVTVVKTDSLKEGGKVNLEVKKYGANVMFCDGAHIGHVAASWDDSFVVRTFHPNSIPMTLANELPLKLARRCLDVFGTAAFDAQVDIHSITTGFEEDANSIGACKEFAIIKTSSGKVLFTGKSQAVGIKQGGPAAGKWAELPVTKSPKMVQFSVGHEGSHALLVSEDGSVFFVGTPRRGEDGDGGVSKARRQPKAMKPKKMIKLEGKHVIQSSCNSGTSAVVTREGEMYMFGKDTTHCDHATGHVTDLKDIIVSHVTLGKAHAVVLTNKGHVYSFGINNKGQCGRDYIGGVCREFSTQVNMADEEEDADDDFMCPSGKHKWKQEQCMVCTNCGECTGYGSSCVSSGRPDRNPGLPCGCGSGDSGCTTCGVCRSCAGEVDADNKVAESPSGGGLLDILAKSKEVLPLDLFIGRYGARNFDQLNRKVDEKRHRVKAKLNRQKVKAVVEASGSDYEQDHVKMASLPPARVEIGRSDLTATHIVCGLQHTVVLLENGEVYTFGGNQHGQLGLGDTINRGTPTKVVLKPVVVQIAAGSNHTTLLTSGGQVYTFGNYQKGQLGRPAPKEDQVKEKRGLWHALPGSVPGIGAKHGRRATWIGASGDQTYMKIDESLINAHTLARSTIVANQSCIGLIPTVEQKASAIKCLMISKSDGSCKSFTGPEQAVLTHRSICLDPIYDVLWSYTGSIQEVSCYNIIASEARHLKSAHPSYCDLQSPTLAVPVQSSCQSTRSHCALHMLGCLDTLTTAHQLNMAVFEEEGEKHTTTKIYSKEDFSVVNRFESHGGGWGYSGHSIEAIRFMPDTDVILGGLGLFGGRGEYFGKIKIFDLGVDGGDNEIDGELLAETETTPYECGAREKYAMLFEDPVLLQANHWYVSWARISGPSSDCGSSGHSSVTTEDQVVFKFKSSKKSNNGTDVNAGQIPQLLYRLPTHSNNIGNRKNDFVEPAHVLSKQFFLTVSPVSKAKQSVLLGIGVKLIKECFESLLRLLKWSWNTFYAMIGDVHGAKGTSLMAAMFDLDRLVYICTGSLRLIKTYICELYPTQVNPKRVQSDNTQLVNCVADTRTVLCKILAESKRHLEVTGRPRNCEKLWFEKLAGRILEECHKTFTSCFHAFYPTDALKWTSLCSLLNWLDPMEKHLEGSGRLLAAVLEALCHPTVKLNNMVPANLESDSRWLLKRHQDSEGNTDICTINTDDNNTATTVVSDHTQFPLLVAHMVRTLEAEGADVGHWTFRQVLDKLLYIVVLPVQQLLQKEKVHLPSCLIANTCGLLASIVSELAASATGAEVDLSGTTRPLVATPNRYTRTSQSALWNTGNGSPDAVCFSVDRPGIIISGICVYGGGSQFDYEVEIMDDQSNTSNDPSHMGRWNTLEFVKGTFGAEDCVGDIAEIHFDRPVPIKENTKYAIRLRNRGPRTLNGDGGSNKVKCADGTTFTFSACSLSSNGTNHTRGQIPQMLYYSSPQDGEGNIQSSRAMAEFQARKNAISIATAIFRAATDLLLRARSTSDQKMADVIGSSQLFSNLLPLVMAYIGPVAAMDPRGAVQVLGLVQEILPAVSELNSRHWTQLAVPPSVPLNGGENSQQGDGNTTSQHYAIVESDHPYKPATVANYKVTFPPEVQWMGLEFDPQCSTAQSEDALQLYIPASHAPALFNCSTTKQGNEEREQRWWPVLSKYSGNHNWPTMAIVLPGNELCFSLETASDYVKDDKASFYGFKCTVVGYEWDAKPEEGLAQLEKEIAYLGGMCAASLMKRDIPLPPTTPEEAEEDLEQIEEGAQQIFQEHQNLLSKGFALCHPPSITQALEGSLPFCCNSNERTFLKDFVMCNTGTSGGRLAAWLQPEPYLDPKQCDILYNKDELRASWPTVITVQTKDQYGRLVNVPNLKVELKAVPVTQDSSGSEIRVKRLSQYDTESNLAFGGHPPPRLDTPYQVTIRDRKDAYHAISMMKVYDNYSFEELRYAAPAVQRPSENMLVRANNDGTCSASWTPGSLGCYNIHVTLDDYEAGEPFKVEVKEPPQGVTPPVQYNAKKPEHQPNKMRKFVAQWSSGLRIRINPSLQSEQIGIIKVNGIISFTDEIHNNDGVWLRLTEESTKKWCQPVNGYTEAWALQYNQHLGKTLLVPVEQPRSILDEIIKETILRRLPEIIRDKNKDKKSGPGVYQVVKCGSSGHNIRSRPGLKATPVGMMVLGNQLTATEALVNMEGAWVKLDQDSLQRYCHEIEGEAWSLAVGSDDIVFLQHEADVQELSETERKSAFGGDGGGGDATKGFDFTSAQQETPSLAAFGSSQVPSFGSDTGSAKECKGPITFGQSECSSFDEPFQSMTWPMDKAEACASGVSSRGGRDKSRHLSARTSYSSLDSSQSSLSPRSISPRLAPSLQSYKSADKKDLILLRDMPPELQGVSVKDLVKALGKIKLESQLSKAVKGRCGKPSNKSEWPSGGLLEAELKGVSIKDIIRLLGESRVNGNGATPPRTPPGTPKKTLSRSSSPKPIPGSPRTDISLSPRSDSPLLVVLPVPGRSSPSRTPPRTPPTPRRDSSSGVYTTPPQTPPTLRKTYSAGASPRLESPSRSRTQRSASCSPQRSGSPLGFLSRPGSSGLGKSSGASGGTAASSALSHAEPIKGHFSIGASSPREDPRQSPKPSRKDRSRQLRTKKERAGSPGQRVTTCRPRSGSAEIVREPVREALSPSVAQSLRAVFAAFMWHEGIVHDAMACASFLKFHPNLPKELSKVAIEKDVPSCSGNANGTGSGKGTPRVTPKTTPSGTLKKQHRQGMELTNINIIEAVKKLEFVRGKERHYSESRASEIDDSPTSTKPEERDSELPATLQHLVYFWEDLSSSTLKVVTQNMILPSPAVNVRVHKPDKKEKDRDKDKKGKKKKDLKYGGIAGRGNLFGEAALLGVGGERETLCELCGGMFPHPVTYHMRQAHLGCGRHAGGQGYNSGGNFCGGWAGNCGDGGVGGSTWYLMCDRCRDKYLSDKRQGVKDKSKKVKKKASSNKSSVTSQNLEPHLVMKNNAMFLLDLSSSAGMSLPSKTQHKQAVKLDMLPSVSEDSHSAQSPFPRVPFLYLFLRGAQAADSAFAEDVIFSDKEPSKGLSRSGHFERSQTQDGHSPRIMRSGSVGNDSKDQKGLNPTASKSAEVSPCDGEAAVSCGKQVLFQRSISEITGGSSSPGSQEEADEVGKVSGRKRNNSGGTADAGTSLLKHPSVAMARLIQCVERAGRAGVADKTLQRPVLAFVIQRHDLDALLLAMRQSLRKAACRIFALQSFNWLMRNVTQSSCLHDLLWHFVGSVTPPSDEAAEIENDKVNKKDKKDIEQEKDVVMCQHPLVDISIAGEAANPLPQVFHTFLQTISDVMMYLPPGSALQQMAVRCWCLKFKPSDLMFLHKSHVFSNISKILSKSDEGWGVSAADNAHVISKVECLKDVTQWIDLKASSRQAMIGSLTDNSTETFWESGEEDHNRTKSITLTCRSDHRPCMVYVHVDNTRDLGNKVSYIVFNAGSSAEEVKKLKQVDLEVRHTGWVRCTIPNTSLHVIKLELKGPDNSLRLRQVKVLGEVDGSPLVVGKQASALVMQQKNCEAETLKVFRILTSEVFGKLIWDQSSSIDAKDELDNGDGVSEGDVDLKEHMVGILFSRSKLTHLQKQVCAHIVQAIRKETLCVKEEWETSLASGKSQVEVDRARTSDAYCFELLSMVLALSGSVVGRTYLAQQHSLLQDLLSLLHTASPRVQRQVTALLRRVLPDVPPQTLARLLEVTSLPPADFSILANTDKAQAQSQFDPDKLGILDVFLACIAKSITLQTKVKGQGGGKGASTSYRLTDFIPASSKQAGRWWLRGVISSGLASTIITLLKDLAALSYTILRHITAQLTFQLQGQLSDAWSAVTKSAIAESILALTKLEDSCRSPTECINTPTLWLALASLCVLDQEHVDRLSSGQWVSGREQNQPKPTCDNHDDGETAAIILCNVCGNLCAECDRFLHLHRRTRTHQRQVFKEEEEAIKVDLHEGCGRIKLFWVTALTDSKTLKALVEFRQGKGGKLTGSKTGSGTGICRFCGASASNGLLAIGNVCSDPECQEHAQNACNKNHNCGHPCGGIKEEEPCLPCLHGCSLSSKDKLKQDADDMCMICFTEALSAAPAIQLKCGHVFHLHCCRNVLRNKWMGPRITFGFSLCPICKRDIEHSVLKELLEPIRALYQDVHRKALMRLEYEGLHKAEAITTQGTRFYNDPPGFAMDRYAYYVCFKCKKAYYGGEVRCEEQAAGGEDYDPAELVCGGCSDVSRAQMCPKHGTDFLEYKCRYCCSVAVFFCFGTTHFCNACHDDFQRVTNIPKDQLPRCPAGPKAKQLEGEECPLHVQHPATGEEFALGCGVCRNAHTF